LSLSLVEVDGVRLI